MKYQIFATAALLLSVPYITAAADPADQAQWSESVPVDEERYPGERVEAYIVDGLRHARRLDQTDPLFGTSFSPNDQKLLRKCQPDGFDLFEGGEVPRILGDQTIDPLCEHGRHDVAVVDALARQAMRLHEIPQAAGHPL